MPTIQTLSSECRGEVTNSLFAEKAATPDEKAGTAISPVGDIPGSTPIQQTSRRDMPVMSHEQVLDFHYEDAIRRGDADLARHYINAIMEEAVKASQEDEGLR